MRFWSDRNLFEHWVAVVVNSDFAPPHPNLSPPALNVSQGTQQSLAGGEGTRQCTRYDELEEILAMSTDWSLASPAFSAQMSCAVCR